MWVQSPGVVTNREFSRSFWKTDESQEDLCLHICFSLLFSLFCLPPLLLLYLASLQQDGSFLSAWSGSKFFSVIREFVLFFSFSFLATVLTWGFKVWVSASVKHLETIFIAKGTVKIKLNLRVWIQKVCADIMPVHPLIRLGQHSDTHNVSERLKSTEEKSRRLKVSDVSDSLAVM